MTKQEEIREGAIVSLMEYKGFDRAPTETIVDCVLGSLSLEDVVIKVDRELPYACICGGIWGYEPSDGVHSNECYVHNNYTKAGYVAVEPLIEVTAE